MHNAHDARSIRMADSSYIHATRDTAMLALYVVSIVRSSYVQVVGTRATIIHTFSRILG